MSKFTTKVGLKLSVMLAGAIWAGSAMAADAQVAPPVVKTLSAEQQAYYAPNIVRMSMISVDPQYIEEYKAYVSEVGRDSMEKEPGVRVLYSMQQERDPTKFMILEIYASDEAYQHHIKTDHFQKYKQGTLHMVKELDLVDSIPLVPEVLIKP